MTGNLPLSIERYFAGKNAGDFRTAVSGFSQSAVVKDERLEHAGPTAIQAWMAETAAKYKDRADVRTVTSNGDDVEVAAEVSGAFPGSPILLRFRFTLDGDLIGRLEIAP